MEASEGFTVIGNGGEVCRRLWGCHRVVVVSCDCLLPKCTQRELWAGVCRGQRDVVPSLTVEASFLSESKLACSAITVLSIYCVQRCCGGSKKVLTKGCFP